MEIFRADNVTKRYGEFTALDDVCIKVEEGTIFGLLGPNGAGKTTLIRIINQITGPDTGKLFFKGQPLKQEHIGLIGYLPEERGLYKKMKVGEQALYLARLKGMSKSDALKSLKYWFEKFEIQNWWDKKIEELSKGMQQKVQFVITILHEPKLLIFDEPFSGFDPINTNLLKNEILELKKNGSTIIFSTHNMASVEELCDDITLINRSKSILEGNLEEIRQTYKSNTFKLSFKGDPEKLKIALRSNFDIIETKVNHSIHTAIIKASEGTAGNELLLEALSAVDITGFNELIPSMNEIFIKVVEQNKIGN